MNIVTSWVGSEDHTVLSGEACFEIGKKSVTIRMHCVHDFRAVCELLDAAVQAGRADKAREVSRLLHALLAGSNQP